MSDNSSVAGLVEKKTLQKRVMAQIESLPSLSTVVGEFLELSCRDYFTAMDFEKVLIKDQALVARLLKVANSSFFGSAKSVETVHEAVVLIGMDNMKNIVYAVSSSGLLRRQMKNYRYPEQGFWLHSMAVGMTCRALMEELRRPPFGAEEAFVAGLLHDTGKLIVDDFLDTEKGIRKVTLEEEQETLGINHAALTAHILDRWKIPERIKNAVLHHHDPRLDDKELLGSAVINMADHICNAWGIGTRQLMDLGVEIYEYDYEDTLAALGFKKGTFLPLLHELRQKLAGVENFYEEG
jgi:putative nucleotidyltransferase with HDIG domain